jgi:hypothetical protein
LNEEGAIEDFKFQFVSPGSYLQREYLFCDVFCGCSFIRVIGMPDFDINNQEALEQAMQDYDADPDKYISNSYDLARILH